MSQLLPVHELIRRLRLHSTRRGNIKAIAGMGEIDYYYLRQIAHEGRMSVRMQALLSDILGRIDRGEVAIRLNSPKTNKDNANKVVIEERPPNAPHFQRRIVRADEYSRWGALQCLRRNPFLAAQKHPIAQDERYHLLRLRRLRRHTGPRDDGRPQFSLTRP